MRRVVTCLLGLVLTLGVWAAPAHAQAPADSVYTVQAGDTLYSIAQQFGVSVRTLMQWNDLDDTTLQVGQTLRVRPPSESSGDERPSRSEEAEETDEQTEPGPDAAPPPDTGAASTPRPPRARHSVEAGDTFVGLALRLGTTADSLFALNDSTTAPLAPDRPLRLPRRFGPPVHVVESGQTLYSIAGEYGVSVRSLRVANGLESDTLRPGRRLRIPRRRPAVPPPGEWAPPDSTGPIAVYPDLFAGRLTASGAPYDPEAFVVSHPSLPFNSVVLLSARGTDAHTFARVIDRGPVEEGVLLDVSDAVIRALNLENAEAPSVALRVVWIAGRSN